MKRIIKLFLVSLIAFSCFVQIGNVQAAEGDQFAPIHIVYRNDGGGMFGTHAQPSYKEGSTQYYRDGDIIEVNFTFPEDHGSQIFSDIVKFDSTKVTLLSSYTEIRQTLAGNYLKKGWSTYVSKASGDSEQISIIGGSEDYTDLSTKEYEGGTIAKMYFKVNAGVESEAGTPISFEFPQFQAGENVGGKMKYTHIGYDPAKDQETAYAKLPTQTVVAKKPSVDFQAESAFITQSQAKSLNVANDLKTYNNVSAAVSDGTILDVTTSAPNFASLKLGIVGVYDVTYTVIYNGKTETKNVKISVTKDGAITSPDKTTSIDAHNAFISESDAKLLANQNALIALNGAEVSLLDGTKATPLVNAPAFASIKAGTLGSYDVTYSYGAGASAVSKAVKVVVVKDGSIISPNHDTSLYAENGFIKETDAKALANRNALAPYNVAEVTLADGSKIAPTATVSNQEWLSITSGTKGNYSVLYSYISGADEISKKVAINVIADDATVSPDKKTSLSASDVELSQTEAKALANENSLITLNQASVTLADGTKAVPNISVTNFSSLKLGLINVYSVTYSYGSGASAVSKTVNVNVVADKKHEISLQDRIITVDQAKALASKDDLRTVNNVVVTAIDGSHPNAIVDATDWATIKAGTIGSYTITYSYGYGDKLVSVSAKVTIVENGSIVGDKGSLYAKSGFINQTEAKALSTKEGLIPTNKANVVLLDGTAATPNVVMNAGEWMLLNTGELGAYNVTYSYGAGADSMMKSVLATVIKDGSIISKDGSASLYAENAFIESSNAKALTNKEQLRTYNKAIVTLENGNLVAAQVDVAASDWLAIKQGKVGTYDVLYTYGTGDKEVIKNVKINVTADGTVISKDGKVALNAMDGDMSDDEAKLLANKEAIAPYNSALITFEDGTTQTPVVSVQTTSWNSINAGTIGTYSITYSYGAVGSDEYVSKTVNIGVEKRMEARMLFDYNRDGRVDIMDYAEFRMLMINPSAITEENLILSDSDSNGRIDVIDLAEIRFYMSNSNAVPPTVFVPVR